MGVYCVFHDGVSTATILDSLKALVIEEIKFDQLVKFTIHSLRGVGISPGGHHPLS